MYSVKCTVYSVQCTVYSVQCTLYTVQCTVYTVQLLSVISNAFSEIREYRDLLKARICNIFYNRRLYSGIFKDPLDTKYKTLKNSLNS